MIEEPTLSDFLDDGEESEPGEGGPGDGDGEPPEDRVEETDDDPSAGSPSDTAVGRGDAETGDGTAGDVATGDAATADDPTRTDPDADLVATTYAWTPDGRCEACGAAVARRWRDGDQFVCGECKGW